VNTGTTFYDLGVRVFCPLPLEAVLPHCLACREALPPALLCLAGHQKRSEIMGGGEATGISGKRSESACCAVKSNVVLNQPACSHFVLKEALSIAARLRAHSRVAYLPKRSARGGDLETGVACGRRINGRRGSDGIIKGALTTAAQNIAAVFSRLKRKTDGATQQQKESSKATRCCLPLAAMEENSRSG